MDFRFRLLVVLFVGALTGLVWTFPAWRVYLQQTRVTEAFPGLALDLQDEFLALTPNERDALFELRDEDPVLALEKVQVIIKEPLSAPEADQDLGDLEEASILRSGYFIEIDPLHLGGGTATIYQKPDQSRVLRFEDYMSARGGDVHVYLSRDPEPRTAVEVGVDFLDLGRLKGDIGNQNYTLPNNLDLSNYQSVVVFCRQFNAVITTANLR